MATTWKVNGFVLSTGNVNVTVEPGLSAGESARLQDIPILHGRAGSHNLGLDQPRYSVTFRFVGPAPDRYQRLHFVRGLVRTGTFFRLELQGDGELYFNDGVRFLDLEFERLDILYEEGVSQVGLRVQAREHNPLDPNESTFDDAVDVEEQFITLFGLGEDDAIAEAVATAFSLAEDHAETEAATTAFSLAADEETTEAFTSAFSLVADEETTEAVTTSFDLSDP